MKASPLPSVVLAVALAAAVFPPGVRAQDSVVLRNGQVREGKIVGVSGGNIRIQVGPSTTGTPLGEVREVRMEAPPEFAAAAAALAGDNAAGAGSKSRVRVRITQASGFGTDARFDFGIPDGFVRSVQEFRAT